MVQSVDIPTGYNRVTGGRMDIPDGRKGAIRMGGFSPDEMISRRYIPAPFIQTKIRHLGDPHPLTSSSIILHHPELSLPNKHSAWPNLGNGVRPVGKAHTMIELTANGLDACINLASKLKA